MDYLKIIDYLKNILFKNNGLYKSNVLFKRCSNSAQNRILAGHFILTITVITIPVEEIEEIMNKMQNQNQYKIN